MKIWLYLLICLSLLIILFEIGWLMDKIISVFLFVLVLFKVIDVMLILYLFNNVLVLFIIFGVLLWYDIIWYWFGFKFIEKLLILIIFGLKFVKIEVLILMELLLFDSFIFK